MKKKLLYIAIAGVFSFGLSGCGGGGSSSGGDPSDPSNPSSLTGKVADGYLENAKVCLDLNKNNRCDDGEPSAMTDENGEFTLTTTEDITQYPVVSEVTTATIDKDTGQAVSKPYTLSAPAGKSAFVSPLTTLMQNQITADPSITTEEAETKLRASMDIDEDVDFYSDFIEKGQSTDSDADDYKLLHQAAQMVARTIAKLVEDLESSLQGLGITLDDGASTTLVAQINQTVIKNMGAIQLSAKDVLDNNNGDVNPSKADEFVTDLDNNLDVDELNNLVQTTDNFDKAKTEQELKATAKVSGFAEFLKGGTRHAWHFNRLEVDDYTDQNNTTQYNYTPELENLVLRQDGMLNLRGLNLAAIEYASSNGEQAFLEAHENQYEKWDFTQNSDGTISFTTDGGLSKITVSQISERSLKGKSFSAEEMGVHLYFDGNTSDAVRNALASALQQPIAFGEGDQQIVFNYTNQSNFTVEEFKALSPTNIKSFCTSESGNCTDDIGLGLHDQNLGHYRDATFDEILDSSNWEQIFNNSWNDVRNFYENGSLYACYDADEDGNCDAGAVKKMLGAPVTYESNDGVKGILYSKVEGDRIESAQLAKNGVMEVETRIVVKTPDGEVVKFFDIPFEAKPGIYKPYNTSAMAKVAAAVQQAIDDAEAAAGN